MKVCTVSRMRRLDQTAIDTYGITDALLMENAGLAVFEVLRNRIGIPSRRFLVFCGAGNNGGDGFVIARKIHAAGGRVKVMLCGNPEKYRGAARLNWEIVNRLPVEMQPIETADDHLAGDLTRCHGVVDAIFGTGLTRTVTGRHARVIDAINAAGRPVISVDIPSGVQGDTGRVMGTAVKADFTVSFGLPKYGNLLYPGFAHNGELFVTHISFPPAMYAGDAIQTAVNTPLALPGRPAAGHKGSFGDALVIAGASTYYGAPGFAARSFLKAGGGYCRLACPADMIPALSIPAGETVFIPQQATAAGSIAGSNQAALVDTAARVDIVILGPGMSLEPETGALARALTAQISKPLILDGDGITALCTDLSILRQRTAPVVLTPHYGEMARIIGRDVAAIEADPVAVLQHAARDLGAAIVLKGAHSLIGFPDGRVFINLSGNSGMATAGAGDVLTGTIAAMYGLGLPFDDAIRQGVLVHGLAGDLAAQDMGRDGMTARDILNSLPRAMDMVRKGLPADLAQRYRGARIL